MLALKLLNEVADRVGYPQMSTIENTQLEPEQRKLISLLNRILITMGGINIWPNLQVDDSITLLASETSDLTAGSEQYVTATQNSDTVTVANMTFDDSYKERVFHVSGDPYPYRIKKVLGPTQIQLYKAWRSDSITISDEKTFTIAQDRYALPVDLDRPIDDMQGFFASYRIMPISPERLRELRRAQTNNSLLLGEPQYYTVFGMNPGETTQLVHFHPYPQYSRLLQYSYQKVHPTIDSDNDKILYPDRFIGYIIDAMAFYIRRDFEDEANVQQTMIDMLRSYNQQAANEGATKEPINLRNSTSIRSDIRMALNRSGASIDWGETFDRAGNTGFW